MQFCMASQQSHKSVITSHNIVLTSNNDFAIVRIRVVISGGMALTISCKLRVLLARVNVVRTDQGQPLLSLRRLAEESGVSLSALAALNTGRSQRIDYHTVDLLLRYFNAYFTVTTNDLLTWEWEHTSERDTLSIVGQGS